MAKTNKYTSLNFNEIYEKKFTNNNSNNPTTSTKSNNTFSSSLTNNNVNTSKTMIANSRIQGHMLVLTRPTPKPISVPIPQKQDQKQKFSSAPPDQSRSEPDSISLRPQGRTGSGPSLVSSHVTSPVGPISPSASPLKTDKFVPPHLRPGFVGREEKPGPKFVKGGGPGGNRSVSGRPQMVSSPNRYGEDRRPKSGGGYERMRRGGGGGGGGFVGGGVDPIDFMNRPRSSGARPSSSG